MKKVDIRQAGRRIYVDSRTSVSPRSASRRSRSSRPSRARTACSRPARSTREATKCSCASAASSQRGSLRNLPIEAGGRVVGLGDFATISVASRIRPHTRSPQRPAGLMLGISMTDRRHIVDLGKAIESAVTTVQAELPYRVELSTSPISRPRWANRSGFERSLLEALAIVLRSASSPRLADGPRGHDVRTARARGRRHGHVRHGLEPRRMLTRLADRCAGAARGRRDRRSRRCR